MSLENPLHLPEKPNPFGFTEREPLWNRVSHKRVLSIVETEQTSIHRVPQVGIFERSSLRAALAACSSGRIILPGKEPGQQTSEP